MNAQIEKIAESYESFYLYDEAVIRGQIAKLKGSFPGIEFLYSVKCNPNANVLRTVFKEGFGADAASAGEVRLAAGAGLGRDMIFYSAPGKTEKDIRDALPNSVIIADSLSELERISAAAGDATVEAGIRVNPDFTFAGPGGGPSKFGVDEEEVLRGLEGGLPANIRITGIHLHVKSQELDSSKLTAYYSNIAALAERVESRLGYQLDYVNMGSGIGIAYSCRESEIDIAALGAETVKLLAAYRASHPKTRIIIETGRYVVCQSGSYVTHVADRKVSRGKTFVLLRNTLNGFIRPSLERMVAAYTAEPSPKVWEPLYTGREVFTFTTLHPEREKETVSLCGNLCTATDIIASDIEMPRLEPGDIVVINNAGAYAAVLSPMQFSSQQAPAELMLREDGTLA